MWEMFQSNPLGRLSMRKYLRFAITLFVVCFAYIFATAPTTYAADAEWSGSSIVYDGNTYTGPTEAVDGDAHRLTPGTKIYSFIEDAGSSSGGSLQKAHLIYFPSGTEPATASEASYRTYSLSQGNLGSPSAEQRISIDASSFTPSQETQCSVQGIGWIVCPVSNFLADAMDWLYKALSAMLAVEPLYSTTASSPLYRAWDISRNLANAAFVISFLMIIYSYIAGGGASAYTLKKLAPRLVVAAILVNVSYWICAVAIDLSNILGYSVQDLFTSIRESTQMPNTNDMLTWKNVVSSALSGGALAVAGGIGVVSIVAANGGIGILFLVLPLLVFVITAVLVALLVLVARQALIIILVIIAPLAFVAYLLPNTEKWFDKWRQSLLTLLLLFPIFSLIFGGSQLAGTVIIMNASSYIMVVFGLAVQVAAVVVTPWLIKFSGGLIGRLAGMVNNPNKGIIDRTRNWSKDQYGKQQARRNEMLNDSTRPLRRTQAGLRAAQRLQNRKHYGDDLKKKREERADILRHGLPQYGELDTYGRRSELTKQAIQGHHDADWQGRLDPNNTEKWNGAIARENMNARGLTDKAAALKAQTDNAYEELKSGDYTRALDTNGPLTASDRALVDTIQTSAENVAIQGMRSSAAKSRQQVDIASALQETELNSTRLTQKAMELQVEAGGIQQHGAEIANATAEATRIRASAEAIKAFEDASPVGPGDAAGLQAEFISAIAANNIEKARAYVNLLASASNPGVEKLRESIAQTELSMSADMKTSLKHHINSSGTVNASAEDIASWSRDPQSRAINTITTDAATWSSLTANAFAGMKKSSQHAALDASGISRETAKSILGGPAFQNLKPDVQARIEQLAN